MQKKTNSLPRSSTMIDRLHRLYNVFHGDDKVLIVISADPDAIASAMALKRLLWRKVSAVTITRTNVIKRADNLALLKFLKLPLINFDDLAVKDYSILAMVDSQPHHIEAVNQLEFNVVIDHHPLGKSGARFFDVRPDYGATSTMLTEYLRAAKINPSRNLATALFYGIKTDTNNFARQGQVEDMRAFRFLFPRINQNMLNKIEHSEFKRSVLKYFQRALEKVKIRKERAVMFMGRVDNPDTLVIMADFFMRVHDINSSIAAGIFKDQLVIIFREAGQRKNAGHLASSAFGQFGSAGGHRSMARAEVPLANLDQKIATNENAIERFVMKRIYSSGRTTKS
jgi:nanoRNase/pAp phosphatase (c-di-AMP/oligoRNAs hydrolase)